MVSPIKSFQELSKKGYQSKDIQRISKIANTVLSNSKDNNLLVHKYGEGKSTAIESMLDPGDLFMMNGYDQLFEKLKDCKSDHEVLGLERKYQLIVGRMKWLGLKKENGNIVRDQHRVYKNNRPWYFNKQPDIRQLGKFDLENERKKKYVNRIISDIEKHGIDAAWDFHKDKSIIKMYGKHLSNNTRSRVISFAPTDMLDVFTHLDPTGDIIVDEGLGGDTRHIGSLGSYSKTIEKVTGKQVNSKTPRPNCKIPRLKKKKIEKPIKNLWRETRKLYIKLYNKLKKTESAREKENMAYCDINEILTSKEIERLKDSKKKLINKKKKGVSLLKIEKKESNSVSKVKRINELIDHVDFIIDSAESEAMLEVYRTPERDVKKIISEYPRWYDALECSTNVGDVYILNASADRDLVQWYVRSYGLQNSCLEIHGKDRGIGQINEYELITEHKQFDWGTNSTLSKQNLTSKKFRNVIIPFIDRLDGNNYVTSVLRDYEHKKIPEMFETDAWNFSSIEGSNKAKEADNLFVIGSNRPKFDHIWEIVKSRYQEIINLTKNEWNDLRKIDTYWENGIKQNGSQIGWKDPEEVFDDFEWKRDYDFNPLQKIWDQMIDKHILEKLNRKRYQKMKVDPNNPNRPNGKGIVWRIGLPPRINGKKFGKNEGDEGDLVRMIINEQQGTQLEKAKWIKNNIASHYSFVEANLPEKIPLRTVYKDNGNVKWKIDHRRIINRELQQLSWNKDPYTGEETREKIELYASIEKALSIDIKELPVTKKTIKNWVKDSLYLKYFPGSGRHDPPKVRANEFSESPWSSTPDAPPV